jgi:hypothetical protein
MGNVKKEVIEMEKMEVAKNRYVEFFRDGFRLGRISKINGNTMTVILAPFGIKGDDKGQRKRIRKEDVLGIVWRKKIVKYEREVKKC